MYKRRNENGDYNICGNKIGYLRTALEPQCSQRQLAEKLQLMGIDVSRLTTSRIECGKRFVTDIEILAFCKIFQMTPNQLLEYGTFNDYIQREQ